MAPYPVTFDIAQPPTFDRAQVAIRLVIIVILAILAGVIGWSYGALWLGLPVIAAILISQKGPQGYLDQSGENMTRWLRYIMAAYAYLALLTDRLPNEPPEDTLRFDVTPNGTPSVGQALLRIIFVIPHLIVLCLLGGVAFVLIVIAGIMIVIQESYPDGIYAFLRGFMRWNVRVLGYAASLTDEYPPFAFDTDTAEGQAPALTAGDSA